MYKLKEIILINLEVINFYPTYQYSILAKKIEESLITFSKIRKNNKCIFLIICK